MIAKLLILVAIFGAFSSEAALSPPVTDTDCRSPSASCLGYPEECKLPNCQAFIKWQLKNDHLIVDMYTKYSGADGLRWVAFAASNDDKMIDNPTEFCYMTSASQAQVGAGYLTSKSSPTFLTSNLYVSDVTTSIASNALECRFRRNLKTMAGPNYDLDPKMKYYYLGAYGPMASVSVMKKHEHDFHTKFQMLLAKATPTTISITSVLLGVAIAVSNVM